MLDSVSAADTMATKSALRRHPGRKFQGDQLTSVDEMELVANAQGNSATDRDEVGSSFNGIMRKTEVHHAVSYMTTDSDEDSKTSKKSKTDM